MPLEEHTDGMTGMDLAKDWIAGKRKVPAEKQQAIHAKGGSTELRDAYAYLSTAHPEYLASEIKRLQNDER